MSNSRSTSRPVDRAKLKKSRATLAAASGKTQSAATARKGNDLHHPLCREQARRLTNLLSGFGLESACHSGGCGHLGRSASYSRQASPCNLQQQTRLQDECCETFVMCASTKTQTHRSQIQSGQPPTFLSPQADQLQAGTPLLCRHRPVQREMLERPPLHPQNLGHTAGDPW